MVMPILGHMGLWHIELTRPCIASSIRLSIFFILHIVNYIARACIYCRFDCVAPLGNFAWRQLLKTMGSPSQKAFKLIRLR